ncbi:MAG: FlgD immunoglobulin-like domain containing protein [Solirubrobacteraceae bacterium]
MRRLPVAAFAALVIATVAAFFVTQHLKVTTPLIAGFPAPVPATINPVTGGTCLVRNGKGGLAPTSFRKMKVSFYLLNRADDVDVYIVDRNGAIVDTLPGSGRHLGTKKRREFVWDGREDSGRVAPDGVYYVRVALVHQGRTLLISNDSGPEPVTVQTTSPRLAVTAVSPRALTPPGPVTIHYAGNDGLRPRILIYRLVAGVGAKPVKNYAATTRSGTSVWDGTIRGRPAAAGTYLVGLKLVDRTCDVVRYPKPVAAASAPQAVLAIR